MATSQIVRMKIPETVARPPAASEYAEAVSSALRVMARRAAGIGVRRSWRETVRRRWSPFAAVVAVTFVACVALPALASAIYFGVIASRQYVSEMRFAVRGAWSSNDLLGGLGGGNSKRAEDSLVIAEYVRSRPMFEALEKEIGLKARYGRADADFFSRMDDDDPIEDAVKYWRSKVNVKVDRNSGVVTVTVQAFTPEDALLIAQAIGERSEHLVNELSERSRKDSLMQAQEEMARAESGMQVTIENMRQTRNEQGILDATKAAEAITKVAGELRGKLMLLEGDYIVQAASVSPSAPQMKIMASQIQNLKQQIAVLEQRIAGTSGQRTLTDTQGLLERREMERRVAEQQYVFAVAKFEQARLEEATKQVYLTIFVPPRLAEDALYPKRLLICSIVVAAALALWGCGVGIAILIRDHLAI
jgi:capsular polysaccharide transport system permease protein